MSPLRMRMIEDMKLAGLSPGTQATYIDAVRRRNTLRSQPHGGTAVCGRGRLLISP